MSACTDPNCTQCNTKIVKFYTDVDANVIYPLAIVAPLQVDMGLFPWIKYPFNNKRKRTVGFNASKRFN